MCRRDSSDPGPAEYAAALNGKRVVMVPLAMGMDLAQGWSCLLYTSDAADERSSVDLGGRRIIQTKTHVKNARKGHKIANIRCLTHMSERTE